MYLYCTSIGLHVVLQYVHMFLYGRIIKNRILDIIKHRIKSRIISMIGVRVEVGLPG